MRPPAHAARRAGRFVTIDTANFATNSYAPETMPTTLRSAARLALIAAPLLALAGCAIFRPDTPVPPAPEPVATEPTVEVAPPPPEPPPKKPTPAPKPKPPPVRDVVVLFQEGSDSYRDVATKIVEQLPTARYRTVLVPLHVPDSTDLLAPLVALRPAVAIAVGREAVDFARTHLASTPLVFCQVFNYQELFESGRQIWGVQPMPPLALQLRGWSTVDPSRKRIGMIVSEAQKSLVGEARAVAAGSVEIKAEVSSSDRDTLYLFKRLAPQVNSLWLFPDNKILSPPVLRELMSYAMAHGVGVLVSNDALLSWGALASASSTPADVARNVRAVLDRVSAGSTTGLPAMTPLTEIKVQVNAGVARALGVADAPQAALVLRELD
jgi:ABC-type uncharacterized transport system substrate-binding protein